MTDTRTIRNRTRGGRVRMSTTMAEAPAVPIEAGASGSPTRDMDVAAGLLAAARSVVLVAHVHPDADALGSALALGLGLARRGTDVKVSFAEPDTVPESLRHLPGMALVVDPDELAADCSDLFVSLDVGSRERLGSLVRVLDGCPMSLVIDHHASNARFGRYNLIDVGARPRPCWSPGCWTGWASPSTGTSPRTCTPDWPPTPVTSGTPTPTCTGSRRG